MATEASSRLKSDMTSRHLLKLPAKICNNVYRHVLCYDGIKPEVRSTWTPWQRCDICAGPRNLYLRFPHSSHQDARSSFAHARPSLRMQLDVIASVRRGFHHGVLSLVFVSYVFNILHTRRQIHEEAHAIFCAENAFVFSSLEKCPSS